MAETQFDSHEDHIIVPLWRKLSYGIGHFGATISNDLVTTFVLVYYPRILELDPLLVGIALFFPRLWEAISDPLMGQISDQTRSRWGRRRPYLLFGAPVLTFATWLLFSPPESITRPVTLFEIDLSWLSATWEPFAIEPIHVFLFLTSVFYYTAYTVVIIPYTALGTELSIDYHERTRIQAVRGALLYCASFLVPWTWRLSQMEIFPNARVGVSWVVAALGLFVLLPLWLCFWGTREQAEHQHQKELPLRQALKLTFSNRTFLLFGAAYGLLIVGLWGGFGLGTYVNIYYVFAGADDKAAATIAGVSGIVFAIFSIAGCFVWGRIGVKMGKRNGYLLSLIAVAVVAPFSWFLMTPAMPYLQLVNNGLLAFCFGALQVFPFTMVADMCDEDELHSGARRDGAYNGVVTFVAKAGFSGTFLITGLLLKVCDFDEALRVQTESTVVRMRLLLAVVPALTMLVIALLIWFYPLSEKRVREIRAELEARRLKPHATS